MKKRKVEIILVTGFEEDELVKINHDKVDDWKHLIVTEKFFRKDMKKKFKYLRKHFKEQMLKRVM